MDLVEVVCPTCFESFEVVMPPPEELPTEVDYDCEICCRPMQIAFDGQGAWARGLAD
jgi:Cysteine-rich CPXCG